MEFIAFNNSPSKDKTILFIDIPITSGNLFQIISSNIYTNSLITFNPLIHREEDNIKIIIGHYGFGIHSKINSNNYIYLSIIRNPIDRVISSFYYIKQNSNCPEYNVIKDISLYEFIRRDEFNYITCNLQTKYLSGTFEDNLDVARFNLNNSNFLIGISNRPYDTLSMIRANLNWNIDYFKQWYIPSYTENNSDISHDIIDILKQKNENDIIIYNLANQLLDIHLFNINKSRKVIINIPFNIHNISEINIPYHDYGITPKCFDYSWIKYRIYIFMNFTLKSLKSQTNQNFMAFIRYSPETEHAIKEILSLYPPLPQNIHFIPYNKYLENITPIVKDYSYLYEVSLSSDDMYHISYIEQILNYIPKPYTQVLISQNGYIYDSIQNRMAKYFNYSSTFNCFIYKSKDYLNGLRYNLNGFESAILLEHEIIYNPSYINHSHENNTAFLFDEEISKWPKANGDVWINNQNQLALFGEEIQNKDEITRILKEFIGDV